MNAVNLLTLMFAAPEAAANQTSANTQQAQPGMEFALLLQQQIWMNSCPQCVTEGAVEEQEVPFDLLLSNSMTMLPDGTVFIGTNAEQTVNADSHASTGTPVTVPAAVPPPVQMLGNLVDELRQILALMDGVQPASSDGQPTASSSEPSTMDLASRMMAAWSRTVQQFNAWLASTSNGAFRFEASDLVQQPAAQAVTVLPWSAVPVDHNAVMLSGAPAQQPDVQLTDAQPQQVLHQLWQATQLTQGTLTLDDGSGDDTPQSIRWFQTAGIIGRNSDTVNAPAKPVAAATAELPLGDEGSAKLLLQADPRPIPGTVQSYSLRIELPGQEGSLTASLVVQRMDSGLQSTAPVDGLAQGAVILPQNSEAMVAQPVNREVIPVVNQPEQPVANTVKPDQPVFAVNPGKAPVPQITMPVSADQPNQAAVAQMETVSPVLTMGSHQTTVEPAVEISVADRLVAPDAGTMIVNPVKQHRGAPSAPVAVLTEQPETIAPVVRSVAVPVVKAPVDTAHVAEQSAPAQNFSVDHALENLGLKPQTLDTLAPRPEVSHFGLDRGDATALTTATQLAGAYNQPQAVVNTQSMPHNLMQFTQPEIQPYTGLEYLELTERVMEHVNTLKSGGGGFYQARLNLNPPHLGEMFVNISVRGDAVALQMCVVSTVPREQLKDSLDALRQSLEEAGLYVTELRVEQVDSGRDESGDGSQQQHQDNGSGSQSQSRTTSPLAAAAAAAAVTSSRMVPAIGFGS